jgi:RNA polymerase sigma-70 factor (ECF subfamily)
MESAKAVADLPEVPSDLAIHAPTGAPPHHASAPEVARFRALVDTHYEFIWRSLRRLGVPESGVDDAAQHVFWVTSRKLGAVPEGAERTFLFRTAMGVAANHRRSARLHERETADAAPVDRFAGESPTPEELLRWKRARVLLDDILDAMGTDHRSVFVLAELEGMTVPEIAEMLDIPTGTAASRLRRARDEFHEAVARHRAKDRFRGAP